MNVLPTNDMVDKIFEHYNTPGSPGIAVAVMHEGEVVYKQGYGQAVLEHELPVLPSTVFNIGSMAKQFTAFTIALLESEGRLSFEDDIRVHLPEMHEFDQQITIRNLIHHSSGLRGSYPELLNLGEWRHSDVTTTEDVFWLLKAQRELNFHPGDEYLYVNSNYVLLAMICERVSGLSFASYCKERIFDPLGMVRSTINDFYRKTIPGRARGYYEDGQGGWINSSISDSVIGPTNVFSTVEDLVRWDENFYTGEVGGMGVIDQMQIPGKLKNGSETDYAFGLEVGPSHQHRDWQMVEHGGEHGGHCSSMIRFPELHLSVVVLFNFFLWEMRDYALKVADIYLEEFSTKPAPAHQPLTKEEVATPIKMSVGQLENKIGTYFSAPRAAIREVTISESRLQYQGLDLIPVNENRFYFEVEPQTFVEFLPETADAKRIGTIGSIKTITPSGDYHYDRVESVSLSSDELVEYAGRYYSSELDIYWMLVVDNDHLIAKRRKYVDSVLTPLFKDAFSDDWMPILEYPMTYLLVFIRDKHGNVNELRVSGSRVRNLKFIKQVKG